MNNNITTPYKPQDNNKLIKKLLDKICNKSTSLNDFFTYYNKYQVSMTSSTTDFTEVTIWDLSDDGKQIAWFGIDFLTTKLSIHTTHNKTPYDFSIADSLITKFAEIYDTHFNIKDYEKYEIDEYDISMNIIKNPIDYDNDTLNEAKNYIDFINNREMWIDSLIPKYVLK